MTDLRTAAQQALEALEWHLDRGTWGAEGPPYKTATQLIEAAMVKAYKLRPPKE